MESVPNTTDIKRAAGIVAGLRALADFVEANPSLPFNHGIQLDYCVLLDDDEAGLAALNDIAALLECPVKSGPDVVHPDVYRRFGDVTYRAYYVMRQHSQEYDEERRMVNRIRSGELVAVPAEAVAR